MSLNSKTGLYDGYIYSITNNVNGKQYIGQTRKSVQSRFAEHLRNSDKITSPGYILYQAIRKYGKDAFRVETLEAHACKSYEELCKLLDERETYLISEMSTMSPYGYNVLPGGCKTIFPKTQSVFCFTLTGELVREYSSMAEAERDLGLPHGKISLICSDTDYKRISCGGYLWSKTNVPPNKVRNFHKCQVTQMSMDGDVVGVFQSITDAANLLNLHKSLITKCCNGERKSTGGYRWAYLF